MAALAPLMPVFALASAAMTAVGQIRAGEAAADTAAYNARVADVQSEQTRQQSELAATLKQRETTRTMAQQAAQFGASGVDISGSPLMVMGDTAMTGELNRQLILYRGKLGQQTIESQAAIDSYTGQQRAAAGQTAAAGTLLTGGVKFAEGVAGSSLLKAPVSGGVGSP